MRVDVLLLQDAPAAELVDRACRAEEMGFGAVWVADHFLNPHAPATDWLPRARDDETRLEELAALGDRSSA